MNATYFKSYNIYNSLIISLLSHKLLRKFNILQGKYTPIYPYIKDQPSNKTLG